MNTPDGFEDIERAVAHHGGINLHLTGGFERGATGAYAALTEAGSRVVVKVSRDPELPEKMEFAAANLPRLKARGYPAPNVIAYGPLESGRGFAVFEHLDGEPPEEMDERLLDQLFELNDLQVEAGVEAPNRDGSWWIRATLFEGHAGMFEKAAGASASCARLMNRLAEIARPAKNHQMHRRLCSWRFRSAQCRGKGRSRERRLGLDDFALGNRAVDLGEVLVAWALLRDEGRPVPPDGDTCLLRRIQTLAGFEGVLQIVPYHLMAGIAFWRTTGPPRTVEWWVRAGNGIIDRLIHFD